MNQVDIVLLDDDKDICLMVEAILRFGGYTVQSCSSPDALKNLLPGLRPKLLLMDMLLSGSDGRDICRQLKNNIQNSELRILMMSAHPDAERSCREAGADDFIPKPFDMDIFLQKVNTNLPS
jgi:DNA-binding response OmpR family regulator